MVLMVAISSESLYSSGTYSGSFFPPSLVAPVPLPLMTFPSPHTTGPSPPAALQYQGLVHSGNALADCVVSVFQLSLLNILTILVEDNSLLTSLQPIYPLVTLNFYR